MLAPHITPHASPSIGSCTSIVKGNLYRYRSIEIWQAGVISNKSCAFVPTLAKSEIVRRDVCTPIHCSASQPQETYYGGLAVLASFRHYPVTSLETRQRHEPLAPSAAYGSPDTRSSRAAPQTAQMGVNNCDIPIATVLYIFLTAASTAAPDSLADRGLEISTSRRLRHYGGTEWHQCPM